MFQSRKIFETPVFVVNIFETPVFLKQKPL